MLTREFSIHTNFAARYAFEDSDSDNEVIDPSTNGKVIDLTGSGDEGEVSALSQTTFPACETDVMGQNAICHENRLRFCESMRCLQG